MSQFLAAHGLLTLFGVVLLEQLGVPVPSLPLVLLAGANSYGNPLFAVLAFLVAMVANLLGSMAMFWAGRRYGHKVLKFVCRASLSPDSCVHLSETNYARYGQRSIVVAKFLPGLAVIVPPVVGALGVRTMVFVLLNGAGMVVYSATGLFLGCLFHAQIAWFTHRLMSLGERAGLVLVILVTLYAIARWINRRRSLKSLHAARIGVGELYGMMQRGENPLVLDVRSRAYRERDGRIPGAADMDLHETLEQLPRDREVIVYCACPNEAAAVKVARTLQARGFSKVRPLAGGLDAWVAAGLSVEPVMQKGE